MKTYFLLKFLNLFLFIIIYMAHYCINRELDSPDVILKKLNKSLNTGYNPNKTIILNNKYNFNILFVQPILIYKNYSLYQDSIKIIEPKLLLFFNSKLYIPFNSKINYCNQTSNDLKVNILMELNISSLTFTKQEDNSYIFDYSFNNDNLYENSRIKFNYIENYAFFIKDEINIEAKKLFFELYLNKTKNYLEKYPMSDELFLFSEIQNYILKTRKFNSTWSYTFKIENPEIKDFTYEEFIKIDIGKIKFININIKIDYCYYGEFVSWNDCFMYRRSCTINHIIVDKKNIIYGNFEFGLSCGDEDEILLKEIINLSKNQIIPFL